MVRRLGTCLLLVRLLPACSARAPAGSDAAAPDLFSAHDAATEGAIDAALDTGSPDAPSTCPSTSWSTLHDVAIDIPEQPCVFTLAQAAAEISIDYVVHITAAVDDVVPAPQDAGDCGQLAPGGLTLFETLSGDGQLYCLCDVGLCPPDDDPPVQLQPGTTPGVFEWTGRNWTGPSDTGNPVGPPFPPGTYTLRVSAVGTVGPAADPFQVEATFSITLLP